jgi:RNA polymerase sigma factor (sigma-70 family)
MERLELWIQMHQPTVFRAAYLILRDADAAADVAQDTFVRAWQARRKPDDHAVRPWLYRIAVNCALNDLRRRGRESAAVARMDSGDVVADPTDVRDTSNVVGDAIDRLPDRLRVTVICRYFLDLTEAETAGALRVRPGTVKSRLHEARRVLAGDENLAMAAGHG